jgi:peptide chain release factor 2
MALEKFWDDPEQAQEVTREHASLIGPLQTIDDLSARLEDVQVLLELAEEENDPGAAREVRAELKGLGDEVGALSIARLFSGPDDAQDAIVTINSGAGGTDAQDWTEMLLRMYLRWAEGRGFSSRIIDSLDGEEAGLKNVTFTVAGDYAFGRLKSENGIHRLVRISPFDANRRRHTSFAAVFVYPEVDDDIEIEINDKDLRIDTYRASGHGGQHVNKTSSAVRITHLPSGIVVQCQNESSQHRNKDLAMKVLRARLHEIEVLKLQDEKQALYDAQKEISWSNQIRSYVLQPYQMVKDHRTGVENGNVDAVLDGDIDPFIEGYLLAESEK